MIMDEVTYDLVVLGIGSGGEVAAGEVARAGGRVAAVDSGLVGGECPYLACVPSKALLLAAREHLLVGGDHAAAYATAVERRDEAASHRDDSGAVKGLQGDGVEVIRGRGTLAGRAGTDLIVEVAGRRLRPGRWSSARAARR
jgi:dihydrolipoamide dehydrogenase